MKRRIIKFVVVAALSAALFVVLSVKRIGENREAVSVSGDGSLTVLAPGTHFVRPGTRVVVYPSGETPVRVPATGEFGVLFVGGQTGSLSISLGLSIPRGGSRVLYEQFSEDFGGAVEKLVINAAELEAAAVPRESVDRAFGQRVVRRVAAQLEFAGIRVALKAIEGGQASAASALPTDVEVSARPPRKLIIVGVDGGDWLNIEPMVDQGKLPNFKRLIEGGATGPLRSEEPLLSPLLWTTMATGRHPEDHGILNFTVTDPRTGTRAPISRLYRQVDAFWNILSDYDRSVCLSGWLATDPAEKINGVLVSDKIGYLAYVPGDTGSAQKTSSVYPPERFADVATRVVRGGDVAYEECLRFVDVPRADFEKERSRPFDPKDSLNNLILLYASTRTYHDIALDLLESERPDVLAVYFEFVDAVSHLYMLYSPPRSPDVSEEDYRRYHNAVPEAYVYQDELLGEYMDRLHDDTVLMVISDHGFKSGSARLRNRPEIWTGNAALWHRLDGIVAFYGDGVKPGQRITGASILDVAPTILALQGLPRAADMPGKVLATAFESDVQQMFNPNTVASLNREREEDFSGLSSAASEETMKKLEALGYLTPENADAYNNLGQRYQERGDYLRAIEEYRKALATRPDFYNAWNNLAVCYGKLRQYDQAEEALGRAIELKPDDFYAMNNLAVMYIETRQMDKARAAAEQCVRTEPGYVNGHVTLGSIYAMSGRLDDAEREFQEALRIDPEHQASRENLKRLEQQRNLNQ